MLYVVTSKPIDRGLTAEAEDLRRFEAALKGEDHRELTWHTGEPFPVRGRDVRLVVEIQADGEELDTIIRQITGIPQTVFKSSRRWFGDDARFIAANLATS